jgi:FkbM family methyltransferase
MLHAPEASEMTEWAGTYGKYYISAQRHIDAALKHVKAKRVAIQAGGHVGCFPVYLAKHFEAVYTWEPMPGDFRDLVRNLELAKVNDKVFPARGMLGSKNTTGKMQDGGSGSSRRLHGAEGLCPIYRLDDIGLPACDLIYLDVEGDELEILNGAEAMIRTYHPVIVAEERGKGSVIKNAAVDAIRDYLHTLGYSKAGEWMADTIWTTP